jgi:hypothetical protein
VKPFQEGTDRALLLALGGVFVDGHGDGGVTLLARGTRAQRDKRAGEVNALWDGMMEMLVDPAVPGSYTQTLGAAVEALVEYQKILVHRPKMGAPKVPKSAALPFVALLVAQRTLAKTPTHRHAEHERQLARALGCKPPKRSASYTRTKQSMQARLSRLTRAEVEHVCSILCRELPAPQQHEVARLRTNLEVAAELRKK